MAPEIIDLTVDSPPSSPNHPHSSNPSSSASDSSAVVMPNHQPRRPPGRRPRSNYDYRKFIRTEQVKQRSLTGPAPITAGPSRLHFDSNVHGSGNQNMPPGGQNLPVLDALWTEKDHDLFVEGLSKCGSGNWTGIAEWFVKTKTPQQICKYNAEYFRRVRSTASRATRYIEKQSQATAVGSSNRMDMMVYVAPRAKNYASRNLRRLVNRGLGGLQNHRTSNMMVHEPSDLGPVSIAGTLVSLVSAPEQQLVPVSAPIAVRIPMSTAPNVVPVSVSVSDNVPLPTPRLKAPQMFRQDPAEGSVPLLKSSAERGSSTASSISCDHGDGDGEVEDENGLDLELTLGWRFH